MSTTPPCLHVVAASSTLCERCNKVVPAAALHAARLRHMHGCAESSLPTLVEQGVSTVTVVKGDVVGEVVIWVRPRRRREEAAMPNDFNPWPPDPPHLTTDLVAEVTTGCDAVGLPTGLVVEVKAQGVLIAPTVKQ